MTAYGPSRATSTQTRTLSVAGNTRQEATRLAIRVANASAWTRDEEALSPWTVCCERDATRCHNAYSVTVHRTVTA